MEDSVQMVFMSPLYSCSLETRPVRETRLYVITSYCFLIRHLSPSIRCLIIYIFWTLSFLFFYTLLICFLCSCWKLNSDYYYIIVYLLPKYIVWLPAASTSTTKSNSQIPVRSRIQDSKGRSSIRYTHSHNDHYLDSLYVRVHSVSCRSQ